MFDIWNRRYTGSKYKLSSWISKLIEENCEGNFFCDIFAGTGIISYTILNKMKKIYINDFLYSVVKILHITQKTRILCELFGLYHFTISVPITSSGLFLLWIRPSLT
ncbi:DNA adenine methylase [uncultured Ruminococcus sp.]|uniref:DNA adenine methylase n=1 Tax=uncultured Ruminococcus sp. TaxID=165186 RepID=UPI00341AA635